MSDDFGPEVTAHIRKPVGAMFAVRMPPAMLADVEREAIARGMTVSAVIREAIENRHGGSIGTAATITITDWRTGP